MPSLKPAPTGTHLRYYVLRIRDEPFAISALKVRELIALPVHMLADVSADQGCGLILHQGRVLPAVDARVHFFGAAPTPPQGEVVVTWLGMERWWNAPAGLIVDKVGETIVIPPHDVVTQPVLQRVHPWVMGTATVDEKQVSILDVDALFERWERMTGVPV